MEIKPNTNLDESILSEKIILCCGEDEIEIDKALSAINPGIELIGFHKYRSYIFKKYKNFTLILSGIGTGCLEPLLFEIYSFKKIEKIILIGTAGKFDQSKIDIGDVYIINKSFVAGTALDRETDGKSYSYNYNLDKSYNFASIVSTDFYYGFGNYEGNKFYYDYLRNIQVDYIEYSNKVDMVDMEVGQFYFLSNIFSKMNNIEYLAIKGPANSIDNQSSQIENSQTTIKKSMSLAFDILKIETKDTHLSLRKHVSMLNDNQDCTKLIEEVKIYWTVQTATASVLGFVGAIIGKQDIKSNVIVFLTAFLLVSIGSVYNIVGNYYIRIEAERVGRDNYQENVITPFLFSIYMILSMFIGYEAMECLFGSVSLSLVSSLVFFCISYIIHRSIYIELLIGSSEGYKKYSKRLGKLLNVYH